MSWELATVGIRRFLGVDPITVTKAEIIESIGALERLRRTLRGFVQTPSFEEQTIETYPFNWKEVRDLLAAVEGPEQFSQRMTGLDPETAELLIPEVPRVLGYLRITMPVRSTDRSYGSEELPPSDLDLSRFRRIWTVANTPTVVARNMARGLLTGLEVKAISEMYPDILDTIRRELFAQIALAKSQKASFRLPVRKERQATVLLDLPPKLGQLAAYDQAFKEAEKTQPRRTTQEAPSLAAQEMSPAEKMAAK